MSLTGRSFAVKLHQVTVLGVFEGGHERFLGNGQKPGFHFRHDQVFVRDEIFAANHGPQKIIGHFKSAGAGQILNNIGLRINNQAERIHLINVVNGVFLAGLGLAGDKYHVGRGGHDFFLSVRGEQL